MVGMMAQQSLQVQQPTALFEDCTPLRPGAWWAMLRTDFADLCDGDIACAAGLRVFEISTNWLIRDLRRQHKIPLGIYPHEDDLWLPMPLSTIAHLAAKVRGRSSFQRVLADQTTEKQPASLIERGFVKRRFIARPGDDGIVSRPKTTVYLDVHGKPYILVNREGEYVDAEGTRHSALGNGYTEIVWQYRYEIDKVRAGIEELDGYGPPDAVPRWTPITSMAEATRPKATGAKEPTNYSAPVEKQNESVQTSDDVISKLPGGSSETIYAASSFTFQHNTTVRNMSMESGRDLVKLLDYAEFLSAEWTAETIVGLSSFRLAVPDRDACDEDEYCRNWLEPARWLIEDAKQHSSLADNVLPINAWSNIDRHVAGMLHGPTWFAEKRARNAPITLRHVVGGSKITGHLDGSNWRIVEAELNRANWQPADPTPYDGPPWQIPDEALPAADYTTGYGGVAPPLSAGESQDAPPPPEPAEPPRRGMNIVEAMALMDAMLAEYPTLDVGYVEHDDGVVVSFLYAPGRRKRCPGMAAWRDRPPAVQERIDQAVEFGAQLRLAEESPPGEEEEPGQSSELLDDDEFARMMEAQQ